MTARTLALALALMSPLSGCGGSGGDSATAPAAPTGLAIVIMDMKPHLTWSDNSSDEEGFSVQRKTGAGSFAEVGSETFDIEQFHDTSAAAATTYTYRVMARNAAGMSVPSNEMEITTP